MKLLIVRGVKMSVRDRIIAGLDVDDSRKLKELVVELGEEVSMFKIGLGLSTVYGAPGIIKLIQAHGNDVFFDGKFADTPAIVEKAVAGLTDLKVRMISVSCLGGMKMMNVAKKTACRKAKYVSERPVMLGATILSSLNRRDLADFGFSMSKITVRDVAVRLAIMAREAGLDGVVTSPQDILGIRNACGPDFKILAQMVRPDWAEPENSERVALTPSQAIEAGADWVVVGRPVYDPPKQIGTSLEAIRSIAREISDVL
ncbi:orotidine-5'-phosphate decarboxylase [Patescibacteria group bacterium]